MPDEANLAYCSPAGSSRNIERRKSRRYRLSVAQMPGFQLRLYRRDLPLRGFCSRRIRGCGEGKRRSMERVHSSIEDLKSGPKCMAVRLCKTRLVSKKDGQEIDLKNVFLPKEMRSAKDFSNGLNQSLFVAQGELLGCQQ